LIEFRCERCGKKLAMVKGIAEIKCPRCKKLNKINTEHRKSAS
jgi:phage FluMu protein Com